MGLNVVCVNTNNYLGRGWEYVARLKKDVDRHLTLPHRFFVMSDEEHPDFHCIPSRFKGWWEKIRIFEPGLFGGKVLYLDLDTMIFQNIDHIAAYDGDFAILHDFWRPRGLGPAVMVFDAAWAGWIYEEWAGEGYPMLDPRGDQAWLENRNQGRFRKEVDILQELFPMQFASYKEHCREKLHDWVRVLCFHGNPRPHEAGGWVKEVWNG